MEGISIRPITEIPEVEAVEALQQAVWGMSDSSSVVPNHLLITAAHHGGVLLGAFTPDTRMIGFVFGFIGSIYDERVDWMSTPYLHCSHMLGVLSEYRNGGLGYDLKVAQREVVLAQRIKLIIWTFDPLMSTNAWLNIARLGGVVRQYIPNLYGELRESLNAGLPTDRFELEWWIGSERVKRHLSQQEKPPTIADWRKAGAKVVNRTEQRGEGIRAPMGWNEDKRYEQLLVEIPADFQAVRHADMGLASDWRMTTREIFTWAFNSGYVIAWMNSEMDDGHRRSYYVLTRRIDVRALAGEKIDAH